MTEAEWLACDDPGLMPDALLEGVGDQWEFSDRKYRLVCCACCRVIWGSIREARDQAAIHTAERFADGLASEGELNQASADLGEVARSHLTRRDEYSARRMSETVTRFDGYYMTEHLEAVIHDVLGLGGKRTAPPLVALVRDVFGNPFRPTPFEPAWRTPAAVSLAQVAYDERDPASGRLDPARLAVLSDALEEAGCADADILTHLRSPGPHVRGCWALDLVLGRE